MTEYSKKIDEQSIKIRATFLESAIVQDWKISFHAAFYHFYYIVHGISLVSNGCFVPPSRVHNEQF